MGVAAGTGEVAGLYGGPEEITNWVLSQPLEHAGRTFPSRVLGLGATSGLETISAEVTDPLGPSADAVVERARAARAAGAPGFWFTGPHDRPAVLTRLDLAERVRTEAGGLIVVDAPRGLRDDVVAGLVSARADLICFTEEA